MYTYDYICLIAHCKYTSEPFVSVSPARARRARRDHAVLGGRVIKTLLPIKLPHRWLHKDSVVVSSFIGNGL